jgi:hypothetical protein
LPLWPATTNGEWHVAGVVVVPGGGVVVVVVEEEKGQSPTRLCCL